MLKRDGNKELKCEMERRGDKKRKGDSGIKINENEGYKRRHTSINK